MKKITLLFYSTVLGLMATSCAFRLTEPSFGPYSDAETFYKKGNYSKAIGKYQEYVSANPQGNLAAIAEYYTAKSYIALGDMAKAQESFQKIMELYPKTSWADFSRDQLKKLKGSATA